MPQGIATRVLMEIEYDGPVDDTTIQMLADSQMGYEGVVSVTARAVDKPYTLTNS